MVELFVSKIKKKLSYEKIPKISLLKKANLIMFWICLKTQTNYCWLLSFLLHGLLSEIQGSS